MRYRNTGAVPLSVLDECVIEPGKSGEISAGATRNPGVASWIAEGLLVVVKAKKKAASEGDD